MNTPNFAGYDFDPQMAGQLLQRGIFLVAIIVVTWLLAKAAKWSFAKLVNRIPLFSRTVGTGESMGASLGNIISLFIWLFGLIAVLQALDLGSVIKPLQNLVDAFMGVMPKVVGAGLIFFVGMMVARIVRQIVETSLATVNFDKWANLGGAEKMTGNAAISKTIGTIVFVMIVVPVAIAALDVLDIPSITVPAKDMLQMVLTAVPPIIGASLLLGLGFVIARWVGGLIEEVLPGLGFDRSVAALGVVPEGRTASGVVATLTQVAIMLFMAIAATRLLGFPELTRIVQTVLDQGASVIFGAVLIAAGAILGKVIKGLVASASGDGFAPNLVQGLTVALFVFIGLKQMNIGGAIVDYAFIAIAVGSSIAFALAFGLGGRDVAKRKLDELIK